MNMGLNAPQKYQSSRLSENGWVSYPHVSCLLIHFVRAFFDFVCVMAIGVATAKLLVRNGTKLFGPPEWRLIPPN